MTSILFLSYLNSEQHLPQSTVPSLKCFLLSASVPGWFSTSLASHVFPISIAALLLPVLPALQTNQSAQGSFLGLICFFNLLLWALALNIINTLIIVPMVVSSPASHQNTRFLYSTAYLSSHNVWHLKTWYIWNLWFPTPTPILVFLQSS